MRRKTPNHSAYPKRCGTSLLELMIAVLIASIIVTGLQGTIFVSLSCMPSSTGIAGTALRASQTADRLTAELQTATFVMERSASSISFVVPDRDGDGNGERIRYAWTGTPGGPLTRQYNGGPLETIIAQLDLLSLTPTFKSVAEVYPSVGVEDAVESMLVDLSGSSDFANHDVTPSSAFGQFYTLTLPANCFAWRPTRVDFLAKKNSVPATTSVQLRWATGSLTPGNTVIQQTTLSDGALASNFAWNSFSFQDIAPIHSGGAICLTLQNKSGNISTTLQGSTTPAGLVKTNSDGSGMYWTYDSQHCLVSRLYGKLFRSGGTQVIHTNYLTAMEIFIRMTPTSPIQNTTITLLNHPPLVHREWELRPDRNPTTVDANGDAINDWTLNEAGTLGMPSRGDRVWQMSDSLLFTNPGSEFSRTTIVDVNFQHTDIGGQGAIFSVNALRSGSICAPILVHLQRQSDGTQVLTLTTKTSAAADKKLLRVSGLPGQPVWMHLIIHAASSSVNISLNGVQYGTYALTTFSSADNSQFASIGVEGSSAEYSYARVRVLE